MQSALEEGLQRKGKIISRIFFSHFVPSQKMQISHFFAKMNEAKKFAKYEQNFTHFFRKTFNSLQTLLESLVKHNQSLPFKELKVSTTISSFGLISSSS